MFNKSAFSPWLLILLSFIGLALASLAVIYLNAPDNILLLFVVVIVLASFYFERKVYIFMLVTTIPLAVYLVALQASGGIFDALVRVGIAVVSIVIIGEVVRSINLKRQKAEQDLFTSREKYRSLLEDINDVAYILDLDGRFRYISPAIERISGYKIEDMLGKEYNTFVHADDLPRISESFNKNLKLEGRQDQLRVRDIDGTYKHVRTFSRPLVEDGKISGISGIMVDITDFILAREGLEIRQLQLFRLNEITRAALAETEFKPMLQSIANRLAELFDADGCYITLWQPDSQTIIPVVASGLLQDQYTNMMPLTGEKTMTESVLYAGVPLVAEDVFDSEYIGPRIAEIFSIRSMMGLPLIGDGRWLGAALMTYDKPHHFSQDILEWAEVVAAQVSLAVYKGWALDAERRQRETAQSLRQAGIALSGTLNYDEVLDRLLPQIQKVVPYDSGVIMLVSKDTAWVVRMWGYENLYGPEVQARVSRLTIKLNKTPHLRTLYETREPMLIADVLDDTSWLSVEGIDKLRSWAGVPILAKGEVIALYSLESCSPGYFIREHLTTLSTFAVQASLALQNAQLYEQARRQMKESETLRKASSAVVSEIDLENVLSQILEQLEKVVPYDSASIFIADGDKMRILAVQGFATPQKIIGMEVSGDDKLFEQITQTGLPLILEDAQLDSRFMCWSDTGYVRGWMGVPLMVQGEIIGQLTVDNRQVGAYSSEDAQLVMRYATEASIAIQHARLYGRVLETASRLSILHQASQKISATLDPMQLYEAIHVAASQIMPTEAFVIAVMDDYQQEIEVVYMVDRFGKREPRRIAAGYGLSGYIIQTGKSILAKNVEDERDFDALHFGDPEPVSSFLAVPMRRQDGSVFGMVSVQSYQKNAYTNEDMALLELLATHAAKALDNTRLFAELQMLAIMDDLTGIYNRRHFFEVARLEFERALRYQRSLSLIMMDIDHFKEVNDRLGHLVGDAVLRIVADRCKQNMRETDVIGRYGGEEFVLLMPETNADGANMVAERLRVAIGDTPITICDETVRITISIGLANLSRKCKDLDQLIQMADEALYNAKRGGRNTIGIQGKINLV